MEKYGFEVEKKSDEESDENEDIDTTDMPDLESEESLKGKGLRILTPNQMLNRLPITLAQLKAGNNFEIIKMKLVNYCILCTDQKDLQNNYIKL